MKISELEIEEGCAEWHLEKSGLRKYSLGYIETQKFAFADLTTVGAKELNRQLLDDLTNVAGRLGSEVLYVAMAAKSPAVVSMARSMTIFGFEAVRKTEAKEYVSSVDVVVMRMELNQEDDFVDLN